MKENNVCVFLKTEDKTPYRSDVFDHPEYEYTCMLANKKILIPHIHCKKCKERKVCSDDENT